MSTIQEQTALCQTQVKLGLMPTIHIGSATDGQAYFLEGAGATAFQLHTFF